MTERVDSTSDERTKNNVMRHEYRVLDGTEKMHMQEVKDRGLAFVELLQAIGGTEGTDRQGSRELSLAQTKMEEAVMWATKHITR